MRSKAKMVYGLAYGMEAFGLAQRLSIERPRPSRSSTPTSWPTRRCAPTWTRPSPRPARRGSTETLFGRRRMIPELSSSTYSVRLAGERQAMNAGHPGAGGRHLQGGAGRLDRALEDAGMAARLILQVHDEVILEVPPDEEEAAEAATRAALQGAADLRIPLEVNLTWGSTWADAKGLRCPTSSSPSPRTWARPTCGTRSRRAPPRRWPSWSTSSASGRPAGAGSRVRPGPARPGPGGAGHRGGRRRHQRAVHRAGPDGAPPGHVRRRRRPAS